MRERNCSIPWPADNTLTEELRYLVQSAPEGAPEIGFLVSLWSFAIKNNGLTEKQEKVLQPYIDEAEEWRRYLILGEQEHDQLPPTGGNIVCFPAPLNIRGVE